MSTGLALAQVDYPELIVELELTQTPSVVLEFAQGLAGPRGTWGVDRAFQLRQLFVPIVAGAIEIDFAEANTYVVYMTEDVVDVSFVNLPPAGHSVRVQLYFQQDSVGGRSVSGWPPGTCSGGGLTPVLSPAPGARDSVVLDTFDGGLTTQLNLVGLNYLPI